MGNCFVGKHHQLLIEHSDQYFDRVQLRKSVKESDQNYSNGRPGIGKVQEPQTVNPLPTLTTQFLSSSSRSSPVSAADEPSPIASIRTTSPSTSDTPTTTASKEDTTPTSSSQRSFFSDEFPIQTDAAPHGWQVKRKGRALRLRLAKNRFLQLATTQPMISPITVDSSIPDFETNGLVWVEINRQIPVTAVAMSRSRPLQPDITVVARPLLMAIGDAKGMVAVTEVLDDQRSKFGETLEFPMEGRIRSMDFSPDDQYLIVGGDGCWATIVLVVLDPITQTLRDLRFLQRVERLDRIYSVQFHPMGNQVAFAGYDGKIAIGSLVNVLSGDYLMREIPRFGLIYCLDWSPSGKHFAVGGSDKICAIYNQDGTLIHETPRKSVIQAIQWNHDGTLLAVGAREVAILDTKGYHIKCEIGNFANEASPTNTRYTIEALCWSPDGSFLAIGGSDGICLIVETKGYALVHEVHRKTRILSLAWGERFIKHEYGRYLAISDEGCSVAVVKAGVEPDDSEVDEASSAASSSYFSAATDWILREDCFQDIEEAPSETLSTSKPQGNITSVAFSRCSKSKGSSYLAYAADDCSLTILTTRDWKAVFQMEFAKPLRALVFSYSNNFLALGGDEGVLYVLSVPSRSIIFNTIFNSAITTLAFSRKDERLAVGTRDGVLSLLCPDADWEPVGELDYCESPILAQAWSSKTLAVGRDDGTLAVFDTEKAFCNFFVPLAEFSHFKSVRSLAFGASGRLLAVGCDSGVLSILSSKGGWKLTNQFNVTTNGSVLATKWSPAGRYLFLAGYQKFCRVIDTITWMEVTDAQKAIARIFQDDSTNAVSSIDWSVDGNWAALGSTGGGIYVIATNDWKLLVPLMGQVSLPVEKPIDVLKDDINQTTMTRTQGLGHG